MVALLPEEMMSTDVPYERINDSKPVPHVEVPVSAYPLRQQPQVAHTGLLRKAFCCLSLTTVVRIFALLDLLFGILGVFFCLFIIVTRVEEHAIDHALEKRLEAMWGNSTNATQNIENTISRVNDVIEGNSGNIGMVWFLLMAALATSCFGIIGIRAASGSSKDALYYYVWKVANAIITFYSRSVPNIAIASYIALVCRSHWLSLTLPVLPVRVPVPVVACTAPAHPDNIAT